MQPDQPRRIGERRADGVEVEIGGVAGEHAVGAHDALDRAEQRLLDGEVLEDGLDHTSSACQRRDVGGGRQASSIAARRAASIRPEATDASISARSRPTPRSSASAPCSTRRP